MKIKNRCIRFEIGKNRIIEYSLLSGRVLKVFHIFDNTYSYNDKKIFYEAYKKAYFEHNRG